LCLTKGTTDVNALQINKILIKIGNMAKHTHFCVLCNSMPVIHKPAFTPSERRVLHENVDLREFQDKIPDTEMTENKISD
jgi:hypothetical protein